MSNYTNEWKKYVRFKEVSFEDIDKVFSSLNSSAYCSQKIDAFLSAFVYEKGKDSYFETTSGKKIYDIPIIGEYNTILEKKNIEQIVIVGELCTEKDGKILPFNISSSMIRSRVYDYTKHYVFDIMYLNGKRIDKYSEAVNIINSIFNFKTTNLIKTPLTLSYNENNFNIISESIKDKPGYDGIVIRQDNRNNYKIKPILSLDLVVLGVGSKKMVSWKKDMISYLLVGFYDGDGRYILSSKVSGIDYKMKKYFYNYAEENKVNEDDDNIYIKPNLVIEVNFMRIISKQMPIFTYNDNNIIIKSKGESYTMIHPRFMRIREDKKITKENVGLNQVSRII